MSNKTKWLRLSITLLVAVCAVDSYAKETLDAESNDNYAAIFVDKGYISEETLDQCFPIKPPQKTDHEQQNAPCNLIAPENTTEF
ncbi:Uncharacterised protein [Serratia quinivorans]|jgi:hypothetical protein|uniref:hypothetical protein n=1 Tax=Serratia quinivorans TaxID=137545 RepID=UPI00059CA702|nr:hypothetical protein [Serratia quinivorans]CAI1122153.1 Uncharacterised protein [Serratia quinivorans]SPZ65764.1 Uncharacterised protein [Serratia quinivorans]VEI74081.1 Uncharacterised protein [Serratia quinivorans]